MIKLKKQKTKVKKNESCGNQKKKQQQNKKIQLNLIELSIKTKHNKK